MYEKRYLAIAVSIFVVGVVFGIAVINADALVSCAVFAALFVLSASIFIYSLSKKVKFYKRVVAVALTIAAFSFGALRVSVYDLNLNDTKEFDGKQDIVIAEIIDINENSIDAKIYNSEFDALKNEKIKLYLNVTPKDVIIGDYLKCEITYKHKTSQFYLADGISLSASGSGEFYSQGSGFFYGIRRMISQNSHVLFSGFEYASEISRGVTIGDRTTMDSYVFSIYRVAGLSHVLAISGLHISIISMFFYSFVLTVFRIRQIACISSAVLSLVYSALVGFTPGAVRAAFMFSAFMILKSFMYQADGFTSLFSVLGILLLINPYSICSVGLQLSFLCSLGIMLVEPIIEDSSAIITMRRRIDKWYIVLLRQLFAMTVPPMIISFVSLVFSFPVIYGNFDTLSYISPFINLIAVPFFTLAIQLSFVAYLISPISVNIAIMIAYPAGYLFDAVSSLAEYVFDSNIGLVSLHSSFMIVPLLLSICMICILVFLSRRRALFFIIASVLFCVSLVGSGIADDIWQKDKIIAEYGYEPNEYQYIYLDTKEENTLIHISGYNLFTDSIYESGKTALDNFVVLKYNDFSVKNVKNICSSLKVSKVYLPCANNTKEIEVLNQIKEFAKDKNCDIIYFDDFNYEDSASLLSLGFVGDGKENNTLQPAVLKINDKEIRILSDGFDKAVKCDVAVISNDCSSDKDLISANKVFAQEKYIEEFDFVPDNFMGFYQRIRIEYDLKESEYKIYEP